MRFIKAGNYAQLADKSFSRISFNNKCGERKKSRSVTGIICLTTSFSLRIYLQLEVPDERAAVEEGGDKEEKKDHEIFVFIRDFKL